MSAQGYIWRKLNVKQQEEVLVWRKRHDRPWHSPPHVRIERLQFHLTAACCEHKPIIGLSPQRMDEFSSELLAALSTVTNRVNAWCVLPNHYHVLLETGDNLALIDAVGKFHGRTSHQWNGEDKSRGRKVFFRAIDKSVRSDPHFWATLNYIHHNPVHHRYASQWQQWPWSSASSYLESIGQTEAKRIWRDYPVLEMGKDWDEPDV
jgi:putative transposase